MADTRDLEARWKFHRSHEPPCADLLQAGDEMADALAAQREIQTMRDASISCAAYGHWKEGDSIHADYDSVGLHDVAKLYAKYAAQRQEIQWIVDRGKHWREEYARVVNELAEAQREADEMRSAVLAHKASITSRNDSPADRALYAAIDAATGGKDG